MSFTPFNAPLLGPLLGDQEVAAYFSVRSDVQAMARFEAALATGQAAFKTIPGDAAASIAAACVTFEPDVSRLGEAASRDGLVVPEFVRQLRDHVGEKFRDYVHFGSTSQDVIDTSLTLRLADVFEIFRQRLNDLERGLVDVAQRHGHRELMGRTRMQVAIPITVRDRVRIWCGPVRQHRDDLERLAGRVLRLQFGGAAGTSDKLKGAADDIARHVANQLGLQAVANPWHAERASLVDLAHWLAKVSGTLGKFGQDVALMAQNEIDEVAVSGTGGSSAMAHKRNPIKAEVLVTLARFNATLLSGMHHALVHEQERSGAAWTLEWMLLPQMVVATGASTRTALELVSSIERIGSSSS